MATAPAPNPVAEEAAPAPKSGKKKLVIILAVVAVLLAGGVGGALFIAKKQAAARAALEGEDGSTETAESAPDPVLPTFVALDPFTVNLADRDAERYAQVGVTLGVTDPKMADTIKAYMPVIRNNVLMVLAHKTSAELLERDGKDRLGEEIKREVTRAIGFDVKRAAVGEQAGPVASVYFSNFIIQ